MSPATAMSFACQNQLSLAAPSLGVRASAWRRVAPHAPLVTVESDLPSPTAISRALRLRSSILSTVFLSCLVSLPYDLPDGFGLDMPASLHRGPGDSGPSGVAYPDSRLRTQRNALR